MADSSLTNSEPEHLQRKRVVFRAYQVVWYILGVIEVVLAFRFMLKLLGANPGSGFTEFIYAVSGPLAIPFLSVVPASRAGDSILEWSTLIAMAVYLVVAFGLVKLMKFVKPATAEEVERTVETEV